MGALATAKHAFYFILKENELLIIARVIRKTFYCKSPLLQRNILNILNLAWFDLSGFFDFFLSVKSGQ